ncbi:hypothetical protein Ciccas_000251 [Cichlidogyrus casuarinus]|uniref:Tetraspanin n=1 Tax=Cichlidogyrus casuarinus TaxID=1844966 RepID=A0ABD2QNI2_9PLAT
MDARKRKEDLDVMNGMTGKQRDVIRELMKLKGPKKVLFNQMTWKLIHVALYILYSIYSVMGFAFLVSGILIEYGEEYVEKEIIPEYARLESTAEEQEKYYQNAVKIIAIMQGYIGPYILAFGTQCSLIGIIGIIGQAKAVYCFMVYGAVANLIFLMFWYAISLVLGLGEVGISEILAYFFSQAVYTDYIFDNDHRVVTGFTLAWDEIQSKLECCGAIVYTDYKTIEHKIGNYTVPSSCCRNASDRHCWTSPNNENSFIAFPCKIAFWDVLQPYTKLANIITDYIHTLVFMLFWFSWVCILKIVLIWRYKIRCLNEAFKKA